VGPKLFPAPTPVGLGVSQHVTTAVPHTLCNSYYKCGLWMVPWDCRHSLGLPVQEHPRASSAIGQEAMVQRAQGTANVTSGYLNKSVQCKTYVPDLLKESAASLVPHQGGTEG
jgi:hypothetical protein